MAVGSSRLIPALLVLLCLAVVPNHGLDHAKRRESEQQAALVLKSATAAQGSRRALAPGTAGLSSYTASKRSAGANGGLGGRVSPGAPSEGGQLASSSGGRGVAPVGYDRFDVPPGGPEGLPLNVFVDVQVIRLYEISDLEGVAKLDLLLILQWRDERLKGLVSGKERVNYDGLWLPGVTVTNQMKPPMQGYSDAQLTPDGEIKFVRRWNLQVAATFDMSHFPFDHHLVKIELDSYAYDADSIRLRPWANPTQNGNIEPMETEGDVVELDVTHLTSAVWDLKRWWVTGVQRASLLFEKDSLVIATLAISRKSGMVVLEVVFPLIFIVLFTFTTFFVRLEKIDVRVAITSIGFLTVMAFIYVVKGDMPRISYATWVHSYLVTSFFFVFVINMEVVLCHYLDPSGRAGKMQTTTATYAQNAAELNHDADVMSSTLITTDHPPQGGENGGGKDRREERPTGVAPVLTSKWCDCLCRFSRVVKGQGTFRDVEPLDRQFGMCWFVTFILVTVIFVASEGPNMYWAGPTDAEVFGNLSSFGNDTSSVPLVAPQPNATR